MSRYDVHICSFDGAGLSGKDRYDYEKVKAAVLRAGRFSIFEATANKRTCAVYERLHRDPDLVTDSGTESFPWIAVRLAPAAVPRRTPEEKA